MLPREKERVVLTCWEHFELRKKYGAKDERQCGDCFHCRALRSGMLCPGLGEEGGLLRACVLGSALKGRGPVLWDPLWPACGRFVQRFPD